MATVAPASPIDVALHRVEAQGARTRPIVAAAILIAVLSLAAATVLMFRSMDQARQLAVKTGQLEEKSTQLELARQRLLEAVRDRDRIAAELARNGAVLASGRATPEQVQAARESTRELTQTLPSTSGGGFSTPAATPVASPQLLTLGTATGWDIDMFWCAGDGAAANYAVARAAAMAIAGPAARSTPIASGVRLGRIRLLPVRPQDGALWRRAMQGRSLLLVTDGGPGEADAARAVLGQLPGLGAAVVDQQTIGGNQAISRWYLSGFACAGG